MLHLFYLNKKKKKGKGQNIKLSSKPGITTTNSDPDYSALLKMKWVKFYNYKFKVVLNLLA